ncbi:hypothetical protein JAU75_12800 [Ochrobactrum sp. Q0168]|uniref:hypothetical protein n=1 Tax=Ochrobactrum sp. Q0168 TaxID=2793241 RepID=UPI0018EDF404|nr:hypothetical protein [Ochrobactrum sp. Q0168]
MMVSVGLRRASRGLTAIPVHAVASRNRGVLRRGPAKRRAAEEGFLAPRGMTGRIAIRQGKKPARPAEVLPAAW